MFARVPKDVFVWIERAEQPFYVVNKMYFPPPERANYVSFHYASVRFRLVEVLRFTRVHIEHKVQSEATAATHDGFNLKMVAPAAASGLPDKNGL
jgi:hypothetical protein